MIKDFFKNQYINRIEKHKKEIEEKIENSQRYQAKYNVGLDDIQVEERKKEQLINKKKKVVTKTYGKIILENLFPFFNVLLYILAILVALAGRYEQLLFLLVITCNSFIGLIQDIRARISAEKLSIVNNAKNKVIRNGNQIEILANQIVLDDIVFLKNGDQVPADSEVVYGKASLNEAMLTGEPDAVRKKVGDTVLSGTFVSSGECYVRVMKIGATNAAEIIQAKAQAFSKPKSEILKSLNLLFKVISVIVIVLALLSIGAYVVCLSSQPGGFSWETFIDADANGVGAVGSPLLSFVGSMVSMIPAGLFLLTSFALSVGLISLGKKGCNVQELYSIEMLARVDVLCLDKTGTLTDGTMNVSDYIRIDRSFDLAKAKTVISSIIAATKDDNFTSVALASYFGNKPVMMGRIVLPFSSETKYSAATFDKGGTYAIGANGYIKISNKQETDKLVKQYSAKGYRCIIIAHGKGKIEKESLPSGMTCVGLILLEDHIRKEAPDTLKWFAENGVDIKVISGDDPRTVSEIAKKSGITNATSYISLEGMSNEQVREVATKYTIFGRVSPEQKEQLVIELKNNEKTVAMTGDGVNDILALKRSDCSIAMGNGSDAAKKVSQMVLKDSNFAVLPKVVAEGRRVINNIQRTTSLFLSKTFTSIVITLVTMLAMYISKDIGLKFPLSVGNFYIWETAFIGIAASAIALEPNATKIQKGFLANALKRAGTVAVTIIFAILFFYTLYLIDMYTQVGLLVDPLRYPVAADFRIQLTKVFQSMCSIIMTFLGAWGLINVCRPFSKYRIFVVSAAIGLCAITVAIVFNIHIEHDVFETFGGMYFQFEFTWMSTNNWLWVFVLLFAMIAAFKYIQQFINSTKIITFLEQKGIRFDRKKKKEEDV